MKRDMDLVRSMLKDFSEGKGRRDFDRSSEDQEYLYHLEIMRQAGLISFKETRLMGGTVVLNELPKLTWLGNDFLETFVNDTVWNKVKNVTKEKGMEMSAMPLDLLMDFGKMTLRNIIGLD